MCPFTVGGEALDFEYAEAFDFEDDAAEEGRTAQVTLGSQRRV